MNLQLGKCANCDANVMDLSQPPQKRKLDNYCENWFRLSDGSLMKVALCSDCNNIIDDTMAQNIIQRHLDTWTDQIQNDTPWDQAKKDKAIADMQVNKQLDDYNIDHIQAITDDQEAINQAVASDKAEKLILNNLANKINQ